MKRFQWIFRTLQTLYSGIKRFPMAIMASVGAAVVFMIMNHLPSTASEWVRNDYSRVLIGFIMAIPFVLTVHLFLERLAKPPFYKNVSIFLRVGAFLPFIAGIILYTYFCLPDFDMEPILRTVMLTAMGVLVFAGITHWWSREGLALHSTRLLIRLFVTVLYAGILMLSLFAILFTIDRLLGVDVNDKAYGDTAILVWSLFATTYFYAGIPGVRETFTKEASPKTLRVLLHYILIPLLWVYTAILYIYSAKIIIERVWPEGLVSSLILAYTCTGILFWFLSNPIHKDNKIATFNNTWFAFSALPLFLVLFPAIGIRVGEYGLTEPRWFALILAIWCAVAVLFIAVRTVFTWRYAKKNPGATIPDGILQTKKAAGDSKTIRTAIGDSKTNRTAANVRRFSLMFLPISLAVVALISVVGPVSAFSLSKASQNKELTAIFSNNGMLQDGRIQKAVKEVTNEDKRRISSILYWFDSNHNLSDVAVLPENFVMTDVKTTFGFSFDDIGGIVPGSYRYARYQRDITQAIPIADFDILFPINYDTGEKKDSASGLSLIHEQETQTFTLFQNNIEIYSEDLTKRFQNLYETYGAQNENPQETLPMSALSFEITVNDMRIHLILNAIEGSTNGDSKDMKPGYAEGWLLVDLPN